MPPHESRFALTRAGPAGYRAARDGVSLIYAFKLLGIAVNTRLSDQQQGPFPVTAVIGRMSEGFAWQELGLTFIRCLF